MKHTYYLFGSDAVRIYFDEGFEGLVDEIKHNDISCSTFDFEEGVTPSENIVEAFDGWDGYATITESEYNIINEIEQN